jgi:hypothetical protein
MLKGVGSFCVDCKNGVFCNELKKNHLGSDSRNFVNCCHCNRRFGAG